jgi:hypothetical protein
MSRTGGWLQPLLQVVAHYERLSAVLAAGRAGRGRTSGPQYSGVAAIRSGGLILVSDPAHTAMPGLRFPCSPGSRSGEVMRSQPPASRAGCQGRSSVGRSTLTAGHRCPTCTTIPGAIQLASMPGEVSSPGPPPRSDGRSGQPAMRRRLLRRRQCCPPCQLPFDALVSPPQQGGGHPAADAALTPEKPPLMRGTHRRPGSLAGASKSERSVTTARWKCGKPSAAGSVTCRTIPQLPFRDRRIITSPWRVTVESSRSARPRHGPRGGRPHRALHPSDGINDCPSTVTHPTKGLLRRSEGGK